MSWNPPEGIDIEEVEAVAREMGYISDKSPDEYFHDLRESGVTVFGVPERVNSYFDPQAEHWTEPMFPAMDMPGGPLRKPIDPANEWIRHIAVLVAQLGHILPPFDDPYDGSGSLDFSDPEAEWVSDKQNQRTLEAYIERADAEDIFEAKNRMRWFTFITNLDVSETEARALRRYYHYRWAIESAYGTYKTHFLPGTRSTELGLRTYLYLFGTSAFNAWVAANIKARRQHLEDNERKRPPIRASRFTTLGQQRYRTDEFLTESINFEVD